MLLFPERTRSTKTFWGSAPTYTLCRYSCCYFSVPYISGAQGAAGGFPHHPSYFCTFSLLCEAGVCGVMWTPAIQATFYLISFPACRVIPARELRAAADHPLHGADSTLFCNNSGQLLTFAQLAGHTTGQLWEYGFAWESVHFSASPLSWHQHAQLHRAPPMEWGHPEFWTNSSLPCLLVPVLALPHTM